MTDFRFETDAFDETETVKEISMDDYEKYRLKTGDYTIDIAVIGLEDRDPDEYIRQRKNEISSSETEVPHPYKPEKTSRESGGQLIEFSEMSGKGVAGPEYNLVDPEGEEIARYRYIVLWKKFEEREKMAEIEVYAPVEEHSEDSLLQIAESFRLE